MKTEQRYHCSNDDVSVNRIILYVEVVSYPGYHVGAGVIAYGEDSFSIFTQTIEVLLFHLIKEMLLLKDTENES